jgi:hypothetical protein
MLNTPLQKAWDTLRDKIAHPDTPPDQLAQMRALFITGALAYHDLIEQDDTLRFAMAAEFDAFEAEAMRFAAMAEPQGSA